MDPVTLDGLLATASVAVGHHDVQRALAALTEYVNRNPEHASTLLNTPSLSPIQGEVKEMLHRITIDARTDAIRLISTAGMVVDAAAKHPQGLDSAAVLAIAGRFVESGQLANYVRAAELSQAVMAFYAGEAPDVRLDAARRKLLPAKAVRRPLLEFVGAMWRRVPLLVLLLGWLGLGVAGGLIALLGRWAGGELNPSTVQTCVEVWGTGFLPLVVFQFLIRVNIFR
jgi:hypothetical protein